MIKLITMLVLISVNTYGQAIKEEVYSCKGDLGEVVARIFFDPKVYCQESQVHNATLVKESKYGATVFEGVLRSGESGALFQFEQMIDGAKFILELKLPHEMGEGVLHSIYDEDLKSESTLNCIIKQIHVDCDS